jgi:hypothetical protein
MPSDVRRDEGLLSRTDGVVGYTPIEEVAPSFSGPPGGRVDGRRGVFTLIPERTRLKNGEQQW